MPARPRARLRLHALATLLAVVSCLAAVAESRAAEHSAGSRATDETLTPVTQRVLSPPRWYRADDGRFHLEYELELTNGVPLAVNVTSLQVRSAAGRRIETLSGKRLKAAMSLLASPEQPTTELPPSTVGIVWIDLSFAHRGRIPGRVEHRLTIDVGPGLPIGPLITRTGGDAKVASDPATEIGAPLHGGRWVAVVGPHRRSLQPVNGGFHLGQRFAIDWSALLDPRDRTHAGNPDRNRSYFNYGQPVLAVGAGKVVEAVDRYPDQIPNHKVPVPLAAADGNHVILRLGKGLFAGYAHLRPGSVRVHRGERVRRGQVIGRLGNSGNSSGPHLHFQLMNRPSLLDSDGLPFVLDRFRLDGRVPSLQALIDADAAPPPVPPVPIDRSVRGSFRDRGLTDLDVVTLPDR
jgi:murein DD-endopeptidase MepM/ murein hydrolase activator NlpD